MRSEPLQFTWKDAGRDGVKVLELVGPLTLENLFVFQEQVREVKPQVLILDLTRSEYMDSAGLGALLNLYVSAQKRGGRLLLVGVNHRLMALFETTKVHEILKSYPTLQDALNNAAAG